MGLARPRISLAVVLCSIMITSILYAPALTALNGESHSSPRVTFPTPLSCSTSCPPQQPPVMIGWGGLRLDSATTTCSTVCYQNSTFVSSNVFPGQSQTDMERLVVRMKGMGLNTVRVSFAPYCTNPAGDPSDSPYSFTDAQNMVKIANYYNFWIVLRYDGDNDISTSTTCWLNYWQPIIQQVGPLYGQIVWEPINEPSASVTTLSAAYQQWINLSRSIGDQHFIVVENQCSNSCPYADVSQGYPTVTDPLGKVLISLHDYMSYRYSTWTIAAAQSYAQQDYQAVLKGEQTSGWYALDTEGGPDPQSSTCGGSITSGCPPDDVLPGSAGYATVSMVFINALTQLFDHNNPRINWVWWPAGTWTDTPCAGTYGALQPANCPGGPGYSGGVGWGNLLAYVPVGSGPPSPLSASFTYSPAYPSTGTSVTFTATATGGTTPYNFSWSFGDGATTSGSIPSHAYSSPGQYSVSLTVKDGANQTSATSEAVIVTSPTSLSGSFTYSPTSPSPGTVVSFTAKALGGTPSYNFDWDFGDGTTGRGPTVTDSYNQGGSYVVTLTVSDGANNAVTVQRTVTVANPVPNLSGNFTVTPQYLEQGTTISFTTSSSGGIAPYTYSWNFGDGGTATGSAPVHLYVSAGNYTVTLTVGDSKGQTTTASQVVDVHATQQPPSPPPSTQPPSNQPNSGGICLLCPVTTLLPTLSILTMGIVSGALVVGALFLARNHAYRRRISALERSRSSES